jgi:hypothetical protein
MMANTPVAVSPSSEQFPALQYLKPADFTEYSPLVRNPFPAKKFRCAAAQENIVLARK